ncbi:MAG TPA: DUF5989 family protein [Leptospiraceae bacterium]|jgi:hypothetical protein|nr:hypothetical protein [Leptospirales bacterium]HMU82732.1 DUF5989 family protein [Leptospiraceae bacterium]HMW59115.1 DUF5989 family protein [Leptospiraceae bacterium]HMX57660.1 DUF5989 family protein [Leptospiraceae bacterium]HMY45447.1 DUF5989 family protein [Leptospiraceae bacterium]
MTLLMEFVAFLRERKKFWILPIFFFVVLLVGLGIVATGAGGLSPFIYALF